MTDTNMQKELNDKMFRTLLDDRLSSKMKANVIENCIDKGADINARSYDGKTALIMGAYGAAGKDGVEMLIKQGADLGAKSDDGRTAEDWARDWRREEVAEVLKRHAESKKSKGVMNKFIDPREGR